MFLLMGLCAGIAAFALLVGAVWAYFKQQRQMESRAPATGTVVELIEQAGRRSSIFCPLVEFSMPSGQKVRFTSDFGSRPASHQIGQSVKVRYDPADPQKAEIESRVTLWLTPLILVFMGAIVCCLAVVFLGVYLSGLFMKKDLQSNQPLKVSLSFLAGCKLLLFLGLANKGWQIYSAAFDIPFVRQAAAATRRMDGDSILSRLDDRLKGGFTLF